LQHLDMKMQISSKCGRLRIWHKEEKNPSFFISIDHFRLLPYRIRSDSCWIFWLYGPYA